MRACVRVRACVCLSACPPSSLPRHSLPSCASAVWFLFFVFPRGPSKNQAADFQIPLPCLFPRCTCWGSLLPLPLSLSHSSGCSLELAYPSDLLPASGPFVPQILSSPISRRPENISTGILPFRFSSPAANSSVQLRPPVDAAPPDVGPGASLDAHTVKHMRCVPYAQRTCCCLVYALNLHMHALASHTYGRSPSPGFRPLLLSQVTFTPPICQCASPLLLASVWTAGGETRVLFVEQRDTFVRKKGVH